MAYQPKSYRKFLATSVTAALVATVAAPAIPSVNAAANFADTIPAWAADAVDYLVDKGAIEGKGNNIFDPNGNLTRAEAATILARTLDLEIKDDAKTDFADAKDHWGSKYIAAIQEQLPGVINGFEGKFNPNDKITRQELAKMVVEAFDLELNADSEVKFSDNTGWGKEFISILASNGIVNGKGADKFEPNSSVTRAETAVFVHRTEVESARLNPEANVLSITSVTALDDTNRFLQIDFSKAVKSLESADIQIEDAKSKERYGVKSVTLSSNGRTAQVELFSHESVKNVLNYLTDYKITVKADGRTLEYTFNRPAFIENYVVNVQAKDRKITIIENASGSTKTLEVPTSVESFDFQTVLGEEVSVWYDSKNRVVDFKIAEQKAKYDAIEITKANEIKLLTEDKKYDTSDDKFDNSAKSDKFAFYLNGEKANIADYVNKKFNYAKVGYDDSGDILFVSAYNLDQFLIVDKVEGNEVVGIEGDYTGGAFNAKDATIVKDGKNIALADLKKGDVLFFNTSLKDKNKFAEVYSGSVNGEISDVFYESVKVDGKSYDFVISEENIKKFGIDYAGAVYIKKNGKTDKVDYKAAEEIQAAGKASLYFDRAGHLVYVGGDLAQVESNSKVSILTADLKKDVSFGKDLVQVEVVTEEGKEALHQITLEDLKTIAVNGVEYDIEKTPERDKDRKVSIVGSNIVLTAANNTTISVPLSAEGKLVTVNYDKDGKVTGLEFFLSNTSVNNGKEGFDTSTGTTIEADDSYIKGKRLVSSTLVFDATDGYKKNPIDIKAADVTVTTWGEYKGSDFNEADFIYNDKNEVVALVIKQTTTTDQVYEEAVITKVLRNTDNEIVEISAFVGGKEVTLKVDKLKNPSNLSKGDVAVLEFSKNNKELVKAILASGNDKDSQYANRIVTGDVADNAVNVGSREVTIDGVVYRLVSDGAVINASNKDKIETKSLTDLRGKKNVTVVLDEKTGTFVKYFVYGTSTSNQGGNQGGIEGAKAVTYVNADTTKIEVDGTVYTLDASTVLRNEVGVIEYDGVSEIDGILLVNDRVFDIVANANKVITSFKYEAAASDRTAASNVIKLINDLPANSANDFGTKVGEARSAYGNLSATQKNLVTNLAKLVAAEKAVEEKVVAAAKDALNITFTGSETANGVTNDLILPTNGTGATIAWASSDTSVISTTGTVSQPSFTDGATTVTLTATVTSSKDSTVKVTKDFVVTVLAKAATAQEKVDLDKAALVIAGDLNNVTADLTLPTTGTNGSTISWASSNAGVIATDGTVTRPNGADVQVTLTATIALTGATSATKAFVVTVKGQ
ncbi:cell wall-binding repeat-containing protein [bacterium LRH843]|nr:cell wall-binding repeat-containing protein [bacterium LRH843]